MWILFAMTSATILASRKIQEKKLVGDIGNALGWMMRAGSALSAIAIWLIFSHDFTGITHPSVLWVFVYCAFAYPIIMYLYYRAMHEIPLSVFGMMAPITPITALITSAIVLETTITYSGLVGIIFVGAGVMGLFYKKKTPLDIPVSSLFVAILAYGLMGIGWTLDKVALAHTGVLTYTAMNQLIGAIATFIATYFIFKEIRLPLFYKNIKMIGSLGLAQGIGWACGMFAISLSSNPGYAVALVNTHAIITALYGVFVLKEKLTQRKIFVFLCMILALIAFAFA